jgi:hypothetical protein
VEIRPVTFRQACAFVKELHRHHVPPRGHKFSVGLFEGDTLVGVAMAGRPVARMLDDGLTLEVNRVCTDGTYNACSALYAACWRAAKAMGYRKAITYTLPEEGGASLRASGWRCAGPAGGGSWVREGRERADAHPLGQKVRWECP